VKKCYGIGFFKLVRLKKNSNKCWRGSNQMSFLGYCQGFVVISHILSIMLKINVYSIIDSNVFGVKIGGNFPLAIIK
jgi:hypothetical protein